MFLNNEKQNQNERKKGPKRHYHKDERGVPGTKFSSKSSIENARGSEKHWFRRLAGGVGVFWGPSFR